jgi:hypothetical protein
VPFQTPSRHALQMMDFASTALTAPATWAKAG